MTYNQVVNKIRTLLESHPFLKDVRFATPAEWLNWDSVPNFPVASFSIDSGNFNLGREQIYSLKLWLLDKSGVDSEFETDVVSDMHGIANDIISNLRNGSSVFTIDDQISWNAVSEKFEDYLSGIEITINLSAIGEFGLCDFPTAGIQSTFDNTFDNTFN
jgi:hypothetical protein